MTKATDNFEAAILGLVDEDPAQALSILTGVFVSLTLSLLRNEGHEPIGDVRIDGGDNRDITIHAPKVSEEKA